MFLYRPTCCCFVWNIPYDRTSTMENYNFWYVNKLECYVL